MPWIANPSYPIRRHAGLFRAAHLGENANSARGVPKRIVRLTTVLTASVTNLTMTCYQHFLAEQAL